MTHKNFFAQYIAECLGSFFLVFFGCGSIVLNEMGLSSNTIVIPFVFGGIVSVMIYSVGHISGAHFNPAVTLAFWISKQISFKKVPGFLLAQFFGGLCAAFALWGVFGNDHSFGATLPSVSLEIAFLLEVILSFLLMFVIISVATDSRAVGELAGLAIGTTITLSAFLGGPLTGASMNPARSLAPALVSGQLHFIWLYLIAPVIGAALGALTYQAIKCETPSDSDKQGCC